MQSDKLHALAAAEILVKLDWAGPVPLTNQAALIVLAAIRASIKDMREPTQTQVSRAEMSFPPWGGHGEGPAPSTADMWRAMVDARLAESADD